MMGLFFTVLLLGFGLGLNVAGLVYWLLWRRVTRKMRADLEAVRREHARIERNLLMARHEAQGGEGLPPELRQ